MTHGTPRRSGFHARTLLGTGLAAALLVSGPAEADELHGTRTDRVVERSHRIALRIDRGHAELVVRRTVYNGGPRSDQAMFFVDVPDGAVATGLASLGAKDGQPFWFRGDLMEAEAAAAKYMELTGIGGYYPKDPALLSWRSQSLLALQVFPCAPGQPKTVEYTLAMPTSYRGGRHHLVLPRVGLAGSPAGVVVTAVHPEDRLFVDGAPVAAGATFELAKDETDLALAPLASLAIDGELASVPFAPRRELVAFHLDAPARLSEIPENARVVVLLDASRSISAGDAAAGVAAAKAYLANLPGSRVEVMTFDREVHPRHGKFVPVRRALADLDAMPRTLANGSHFDDAISRADALLASAPSTLPRRILLLTDLLTRSALTPERLGKAVKSGALVHVGVVRDGEPELTRDDDIDWAAPVRATGGLVWNAGASRVPEDAKAMTRVYEEWARPVRIEKLAVKTPGADGPLEGLFDEQLAEGEGLEHHGISDAPVAEVELTGELWARPVRKVLRADAAHGRLWSALVFGSDLLNDLSEPEMTVLATRGGAVSPVTSYLAIEPGVRPSTEGLDWGGSGEGGGGFGRGIGLGSIGTIGHGAGTSDREEYLRDELSAAFQACPAGPTRATVTLETTIDEVVDVPRVELQESADASVRECLEKAAWGLELPGMFSASWDSHIVAIAR